jgi:N-glycosylase/DNA lyase
VTVQRLSIPVRQPFALPLVLRSHGWVSLPPHRYAGGSAPWQLPLRLGAEVVAATVTQQGDRLQVALQGRRRLPAAALAQARAQLRHMLRLDDDLAAFWERCAGHTELGWVPRRGAGRLLRSATVFEDLMKLLFTTNCTWAATTAMTKNLVQALGAEAPDGSRAFPTAAECARGETFWRDVARVGYRARACRELAQRFADGDLDDAHFADPALATGEIRARVLALHGFGPYAAGQAMRLFGRYDDLALDSWCRATIGRLLGRRKPPSDAAIGRRYRAFGEWAGLALWCELTAPWHGEGPAAEALAGDAEQLWS